MRDAVRLAPTIVVAPMPDRRRHRGPAPEDGRLFAQDQEAGLARAAAELGWLLERGYALPSALKLVGDRHALTARQRLAVQRAACTPAQAEGRAARRLAAGALRGRRIVVDGFNVLTTVEAALAGGVLLIGRDGCLRDMASVHGTYRIVAETGPALERIGTWLERHGVAAAHWLLDAPVANSGRLAGFLREHAQVRDRPWTVEVVPSPDPVLCVAQDPVATSDSVVLDHCATWVDLARAVVRDSVPGVRVLDLSGG